MIQPPLSFMLPETTWELPTEFPDLVGRGAKFLTIDLETRDPNLRTKGPGFLRGDAEICGIAVGTDGYRQYFPTRHMQGPNLAPNVVFGWVAEQLSTDIPKYGANLLYDLEGLYYEGVRNVRGKMYDVQVAEALIDEETSEGYGLDALAKKYLGEGKDEATLRHAASSYKKEFKKKSTRGVPLDPKTDLWQLPSTYVGEYAEGDVDRPERIFNKQKEVLDRESLWPIFELESKLIPILLKMRIKGIRVDLEKAHEVAKKLTDEIDHIATSLREMLGWHINVDSGLDLEKAYDQFNVPFPRTALGNPSFTKDWLTLQGDPLSQVVLKKRKLMTMRDDFVLGDIVGEHVNGRVHAQFSSLKQDEGGTRSGRFSSKNPNLQQVPKRDKIWGPTIRSLFVAERGRQFFKGDYSQQEPRWLVHFAALMKLPGADKAVAAFRKNPRTDYHRLTTDIVNEISGRNYERETIKAVNLGIMYGMGLRKLCRQIGVSEAEGAEILDSYHSAIPFVKKLQEAAINRAETRGVIRTALGRVRHFNLWEPAHRNTDGSRYLGLPLELAQVKWPNQKLKRFGTHKSGNSLIQGSSADQTKLAMVVLDERHSLTPSIQVHDELCDGDADMEVGRTYKRTMETCILLEIPVVCDGVLGKSWGEAKEEVYFADAA